MRWLPPLMAALLAGCVQPTGNATSDDGMQDALAGGIAAVAPSGSSAPAANFAASGWSVLPTVAGPAPSTSAPAPVDGLHAYLPAPDWSPAWEPLPRRLLDDYGSTRALGLDWNPGQLPAADLGGAQDGVAAVFWRAQDPGADALVAVALRFADVTAAAAWDEADPRDFAVRNGRIVTVVRAAVLDPTEGMDANGTRQEAEAAADHVRRATGGQPGDGAATATTQPTSSAPTSPGRDCASGPRAVRSPLDVTQPRYRLQASDFYVAFADGRTFDLAGADQTSLGGDPGHAAYHSIELVWMENDTQMRLFVYLQSDGATWASNEMRIYDGIGTGEWQYARGDFLRTPVGGTYTAECLEVPFPVDRPERGQSPGRVVLEGLSLKAFLPR